MPVRAEGSSHRGLSLPPPTSRPRPSPRIQDPGQLPPAPSPGRGRAFPSLRPSCGIPPGSLSLGAAGQGAPSPPPPTREDSPTRPCLPPRFRPQNLTTGTIVLPRGVTLEQGLSGGNGSSPFKPWKGWERGRLGHQTPAALVPPRWAPSGSSQGPHLQRSPLECGPGVGAGLGCSASDTRAQESCFLDPKGT